MDTTTFWELDVTNCVYSYMIAVVLLAQCYDSNLPQPPSMLGLCQTDSINSLSNAELDLYT